MQLKYNRKQSVGNILFKFLIRILITIVLIVASIFLIEKINFPVLKKNTKKILPMILKSFKSLLCSLILVLAPTFLSSEEKIDIWKKNKLDKPAESDSKKIIQNNKTKILLDDSQKVDRDEIITIEKNSLNENNEAKIFGIYDPADYDFNLNMWSSTSAEDVRSSIKG